MLLCENSQDRNSNIITITNVLICYIRKKVNDNSNPMFANPMQSVLAERNLTVERTDFKL